MTPLIEIRPGDSYLHTLVQEQFTVLVWPLAETASTIATDRTTNGRHGTYVGTGFTRGVSIPFPDAILGVTFTGNQYIQTPDDSAEGPGQYNLSLAGGSIDISCILATTHNSGTVRAIVQKQETNSSGNGYHVALQNGKIRFFLRVGGSTIFNFTRGLPSTDAVLSDGVARIVHCFHDPASGDASIRIDGVVSGAVVTGATTEPALTTAALRVGMFANGVAGDGSGFIGTLAMVALGREGHTELAANLQATRTWLNITSAVRAAGGDVRWRRGITGHSPIDLVAGAGTLSLTLNNLNPLGRFSPGHANCLTGWGIGVPIRVSIDGTVQFTGTVKSIRPSPGLFGDRAVSVTAVDWLHDALAQDLSGLGTQIDTASHTLFALVVDRASRPPHAVSFAPGGQTFPFAIDSSAQGAPLLQELVRIQVSEHAYAYLRGDGTLVKEVRGSRQLDTALAATFDNTMQGLDVAFDVDDIKNVVRITVFPRELGSTTDTELFASTSRQSIDPLSEITIEGAYRDPAQRAAQVGGTEETLIATLWDAEEGGADISAQLRTVFSPQGSGFKVIAANDSPLAVGWLELQVEGRIIRHFEPQTVQEPAREESVSIRKFNRRPLEVNQPYQTSTEVAQDVARFILSQLPAQLAVPRALTIHSGRSATLATQAITRDVGDKIGILEAVTAVSTENPVAPDAPRGYYIQSVDKSLLLGREPHLLATFGLAPSPAASVPPWILGEVGFSELGETTYVGL